MSVVTGFWSVYDALQSILPADENVTEVLCGLHWFAVRAANKGQTENTGMGLAMSPGLTDMPQAGHYTDMTLRDLAALSRSWHLGEAALGMAAINAGINGPRTVTEVFGTSLQKMPGGNIFEILRDDLRGKKVTVIGHFAGLEPLSEICTLTILERTPLRGDLPDPACEVILPDQDIVIATATTLINKTLPRLLELARGARFVLAGPTTPLSPRLFDLGIDTLAGLVIEDVATAWRTLQQGGKHQLFGAGARMVTLSRKSGAAQ